MRVPSWSALPASPWSAGRSVVMAVLMAVLVGGSIASVVVTVLLTTFLGEVPEGGALIEKSFTLLLVLSVAALLVRPVSGAIVGVQVRPVAKVASVAVGGMILVNLLVWLWGVIGGTNKTSDIVTSLRLGESPVRDLMTVLAIAWVGPVMEEFAFRAFLYRPLRDGSRRWGRPVAIGAAAAISSAVFAAIHLDPDQVSLLPLYFIFGLITVAAYELTGTLMAPALLHAINNAWAVWSGASYGSGFTLVGNAAIFATPIAAVAVVWLSGRFLDVVGGSRKSA